MDVNELTPQMRHNISCRICNNAQDETNVGEKEKQTDEVSNRERGKERDGTSQGKHLGMRLDTVTAVIELKQSLQNSQLKVQHNYNCSDHRKESF